MRIFFTVANITTILIRCCTEMAEAGLSPAFAIDNRNMPSFMVKTGLRSVSTSNNGKYDVI